jgi:magnesium-transporting ATPase (P-type)
MFFADWLPMLYNALWTSWPCMFTYIFDRDVERDLALANPIFFEAGHRREYFNFKTFWVYVSKALFHGLLAYYIPMVGFGVIDSTGISLDSWWHSSLSFTILIHVVTYKLFIDVRQWNLLTVVTSLSSILLYYITVIIINAPGISISL